MFVAFTWLITVMIFESHILLTQHLQDPIYRDKTLGFVPTMGALHTGHVSLMTKAIAQCDILVVSIFVNPTQFDNKNDLNTYPRTIDKDVSLIKSYITSSRLIVYAPTVADVYGAKTIAKSYHYDGLENMMEGANRPGHFNGVGTILEFLFTAIKPDQAFFGEKDFQQLQIVKKLVQKLDMPIDIIGCPIEREPHGLAMSSRNERLSSVARKNAGFIYQSLQKAHEYFKTHSIPKTQKMVEQLFEHKANFKLEYFTIADEESLQPATHKSKIKALRAFIVVHIEGVRLIDNIALPN